MNLRVCSVYDHKVMAFSAPMFFRTEGEAIRSFTDAVRDKNTTFYKYPSDFSFHELGTWSDETGLFENLPQGPRLVIQGKECVEPDPFTR